MFILTVNCHSPTFIEFSLKHTNVNNQRSHVSTERFMALSARSCETVRWCKFLNADADDF
jgi:hypothetical protein